MELKQIRYFTYVANLRSFSKAAQALAITQPALSRHIQALEDELRTSLLHRTTRGVEVTQAGQTLLDMGEHLLQNVEEIRAAVIRASGHPSGNVVVGLPPSLSASLAPLILDGCRDVCPEVTVRITEGLSVFLEEWLNLGRIDIAVITDPGRLAHLDQSALLSEEMVLVGPPGIATAGEDSIRWAEVCKLELTITRGFKDLIDQIVRPTGMPLSPSIEFDSIPIIREMLNRGMCTTVLPYVLVEKEGFAERFCVLRIVDPPLRRVLVTAWNCRRPVSPAMASVREVIGNASRSLVVSPPDRA